MGSSSVGKGGRVQSSQAEENLFTFANQYYQETAPLRSEVISQMMEALKTGGAPNAQIPLVQAATERGLASTNQSVKETQEALASAGMGRSPKGQEILALTRQAGNFATGQIPSQYAAAIAEGAPSFGSMGLSQSFAGLGSSGNMWNQRQNTQAYRDMQTKESYSDYAKMAVQVGAMAAMA